MTIVEGPKMAISSKDTTKKNDASREPKTVPFYYACYIMYKYLLKS